jgi:hypothetical protein
MYPRGLDSILAEMHRKVILVMTKRGRMAEGGEERRGEEAN